MNKQKQMKAMRNMKEHGKRIEYRKVREQRGNLNINNQQELISTHENTQTKN